MIEVAGFEFPETAEETWQPLVRVKALHREVLVMAHTRQERAWCAYCFPVPGMNHDNEVYLWRENGEKLEEDIARVMFPVFTDLPYAH